MLWRAARKQSNSSPGKSRPPDGPGHATAASELRLVTLRHPAAPGEKEREQSPDAASPMQTEAVMGQRKGNLSK